MSEQVSKNIFWLTFSRAMALVLLFLAYTKLFRYLGPFGSGQYQFVLSYVTIFSTIVDFGVLQFITKKMSEDEANTEKYFFSFLNFQIFASVTLYTILVAIAYFKQFDPLVFKAILVTGLGMVANSLTYPFLGVLTAKQDLKKVALINFLNSVVNIVIIFLAIWLKRYIVFLAFIQVTFGILDLALYRYFIVKHIKGLKILKLFSNFDLLVIKNIFKTSWPYAFVVGFSAIYNRIDVVLITRILGFTEAGLYTAAYKFFDLLNFFPASVSHVLFPVLSALMARRLFLEVRENLEKYLKLMIAIALPLAVGGSLLAVRLIVFIAGQDYVSAAPVLSVIIWAVAILFIYIPLNSLILSQLTKTAMWILGLNVFINVAGNLVLLPKIGILGAGIMTVVSEFVQGFFYFYFVRKKITKFNFFSLLPKPVLASAIMGLALFFVRDLNLIFIIFLGSLVYTSILLVTGFVSKSELVSLKNFFKAKPLVV